MLIGKDSAKSDPIFNLIQDENMFSSQNPRLANKL